MQPSLEKLRKFFRLEHENGYSNSAIIGGLAKMLDYWEGEARADGIQEEIIQAVVQRLRSYDGLSPQSRADALRGCGSGSGKPIPKRRKNRATFRNKPSNTITGRRGCPAKADTAFCLLQSLRIPLNCHKRNATAGQQRAAPPPRSAERRRCKNLRYACRARCKADRAPGSGSQQCRARWASWVLHTLGDMLYYYPRRYDDYSQLKPIKNLFYGEQVTVIGTIQSVHTRPIRGGKASIVEVIISDGTGGLRLSFFNQPWMANRYKPGRRDFSFRQDRSVSWPSRDEQPR